MAEMTKKEMLKIVNDSIKKLKNKTFKIYFYVLDTKGNPSSALEYIYKTAHALKNMGYDVSILHNEKEFIGVSGWLGDEYADIPHHNIEQENVEITPSDFLFIPDIFANVMLQTKKLPCKRVIIVQNFNNICEFMPVSQTPETLGITSAIAFTKEQADKVNEYFPGIKCHVVNPSISKIFRGNNNPRNLIVNIISKDQENINRIRKPFYWKNELYKWVSFVDLRCVDQELFANALRNNAITIWIDDDTTFGHTLLESLRCGSVVLAKVPKNPTEWMLKDGELTPNILWFESIDDIPVILSSVVRSWCLDSIPESVYEGQNSFSDLYGEEEQIKSIKDVYVDYLFDKRLREFEEVKLDVENNVIKTKNE